MIIIVLKFQLKNEFYFILLFFINYWNICTIDIFYKIGY